MKRCPTCNQTFEEEWLAFCTRDGSTLVDTSALPSEPPPTILSPPMPPSVSPSEQPTLGRGTPAYQPPAPYSPVAPVQSGWQPPPPPAYVTPVNKSLATASMIVGIIGTVAWLCIGPIPAVVALILGLVALSQIKKNPDKVGGSTQAWVGVLTGGLTTLIWVGVMILYVIAIVAGSQR